MFWYFYLGIMTVQLMSSRIPLYFYWHSVQGRNSAHNKLTFGAELLEDGPWLKSEYCWRQDGPRVASDYWRTQQDYWKTRRVTGGHSRTSGARPGRPADRHRLPRWPAGPCGRPRWPWPLAGPGRLPACTPTQHSGCSTLGLLAGQTAFHTIAVSFFGLCCPRPTGRKQC